MPLSEKEGRVPHARPFFRPLFFLAAHFDHGPVILMYGSVKPLKVSV
jgi:hypothetical protein